MTEPTEGQMPEQASAIPTKQFFVSMLTRDIRLEDAILDLVDNCLDGALRSADGTEVDYSKHFVEISFSTENFSIKDDCGGIPRDIAKNYAFKMGRDSGDERDSESETIGMYGIGMKRAIFKMGREALVTTRHGDDTYEVEISSQWLDAKGWEPLPITEPSLDASPLNDPGTRIYVSSLYPGVARIFDNESFQNDLCTAISEHFTSFLQRGLKILVNGQLTHPVRVEVLVSPREDGPAPFVFQQTIDDVLVSITVGLNTGRGLIGDEDDATEFESDRSSATAGWTVFCNDRAVIVGDKSRLTGWGDGIPLYHPQFAIITGVIEFKSKRAEKLPVTTTKRALDTSSNVWLQSYPKMKEGMRVWISYTNKWKNRPLSDQSVYWKDARPLALGSVVDAIATRPNARRTDGRIEFNPQKHPGSSFPEPEGLNPSSRRIIFSRPIEEIRLVSKALFDSSDEKPGIVGEKCFELICQNVQQQQEEE